MSSNYIIISNNLENNGSLSIEKTVFKDIAIETLKEHKHTFLRQSMPFYNSVFVNCQDEKLVIDLILEVKYGNKAIKIVEDLVKKIHDRIISTTNINDVTINVDVVRFIF